MNVITNVEGWKLIVSLLEEEEGEESGMYDRLVRSCAWEKEGIGKIIREKVGNALVMWYPLIIYIKVR